MPVARFVDINPIAQDHNIELYRGHQDPVDSTGSVDSATVERINANDFGESARIEVINLDQSNDNDVTVLGEFTISADGEISYDGDCSQEDIIQLLTESTNGVDDTPSELKCAITDKNVKVYNQSLTNKIYFTTEPTVQQSQTTTFQDLMSCPDCG